MTEAATRGFARTDTITFRTGPRKQEHPIRDPSNVLCSNRLAAGHVAARRRFSTRCWRHGTAVETRPRRGKVEHGAATPLRSRGNDAECAFG
jgi:hypothetical protein